MASFRAFPRKLNVFENLSCLRKTIKFVRNTSTTSEDSSVVQTERMDKLFLIGLNLPEKRNCVNIETGRLIGEVFDEFENDNSLHVAILHGKGGNFCAGMDLAEVGSLTDESDAEAFSDSLSPLNRPMGPTHRIFSKPTIAAISGYAVAGGLELALMCDLRVVEDTAIMGIYNRRFGVPLIDGGTIRLPQLIGLSWALDMILTGRSINAEEALKIGLANRIVACGTALGQSITLAKSIAKFPQESLRADRLSAYHAAYDSSSFHEVLEYEMAAKRIISKESVQGAAKFMSGVGRHGRFNIDPPPFPKKDMKSKETNGGN